MTGMLLLLETLAGKNFQTCGCHRTLNSLNKFQKLCFIIFLVTHFQTKAILLCLQEDLISGFAEMENFMSYLNPTQVRIAVKV